LSNSGTITDDIDPLGSFSDWTLELFFKRESFSSSTRFINIPYRFGVLLDANTGVLKLEDDINNIDYYTEDFI